MISALPAVVLSSLFGQVLGPELRVTPERAPGDPLALYAEAVVGVARVPGVDAPDEVIVAYIQERVSSGHNIGSGMSIDGGTTISTRGSFVPGSYCDGAALGDGFDPGIAVSPSGEVWVEWLACGGGCP